MDIEATAARQGPRKRTNAVVERPKTIVMTRVTQRGGRRGVLPGRIESAITPWMTTPGHVSWRAGAAEGLAGEDRVGDHAVDDDAGALVVEGGGDEVVEGTGGPADEDGAAAEVFAEVGALAEHLGGEALVLGEERLHAVVVVGQLF